jgi:pimeloyl-ACP methyl ester carboxylesterase
VILAADVNGAGPAVVLLHGQPGSAADWRPVSRLLQSRFTVIVPDRLGYGRTGGPAGGFRDNASAVLDLLDDLQVARATVVGHSWSGGVAIALAQEAAARVNAAVLIASVGPGERLGRVDRLLAIPPIGTAAAAIALNVTARALSVPPLRRLLDRYLRGTTDEGLLAIAEGWRRGEAWRSFVVEQRALFDELDDLAPGLADIAVPVTVVIGGADRIVPASTGQRIAAAIPGARLIRIEGAGHLLSHERPEAVADAIAGAATEATGGGG